jgi:CDP-6-deoxy-D-xylo-4-hexulose-3-dehydrase
MHVPLNTNTFGEEEIRAAVEVLQSGQMTMAQRCAEFEKAFAVYTGAREAVFVNSGSSANLLVFFALANPLAPTTDGRARLKPGSEVIVPAVTWSTTVWPIVQCGCIPVLVDSDPETLQINPEAASAAISSATRALCAVHVLGNAAEADTLRDLAARHSLWFIEDTCEALGTKYRGRLTGRFGHVATYSFFFSHHMSTVEGGMITTDDAELADLLRCLRAHGWTRHLSRREELERENADLDNRFLFVNTGFNLRPTEIHAAFGLQQLKRLDGFNRRRVEIARQWDAELADAAVRGRMKPMRETAEFCPRFGYPIICADRETRDGLREHLHSRQIETRPVICGNMARQPVMRIVPHRIAASLRGADRIMDCGLVWGLHPLLRDAEIDYVRDVVRAFFKQ